MFFNKIIHKNRSNIPTTGPIIFAANHPNTMMDPMLIGYTCGHDLYFLAKSTLFKTPFTSSILKKLHVIPVYRKHDPGVDTSKNVDTFESCYKKLGEGGSLLIFPEGISTGERKINPVKTGVARIALETEAKNGFGLGLKIIPVGLNYSDLVRFRSDVFVRYGYPIDVSKYREAYENDPFATVYDITNQVETALSKLTTTLKDLEMESIVSSLEEIYRNELITQLGYDKKDGNDEFAVTKGLINAVEWFFEKDPGRTRLFKAKLKEYLESLDRLKIMDEFLAPGKTEFTFWRRVGGLFLIVLGFPYFLFGLINNFLPYKFPRWYAQRYVPDISSWAPMKMLTGGGVFILYYSVILIAVHLIFHWTLLTLIYAMLLVPSGNFILRYLKFVRKYRQHFRFIRLFYRQREHVYQLINKRVELIKFLNSAKNDYMDAIGLKQTY